MWNNISIIYVMTIILFYHGDCFRSIFYPLIVNSFTNVNTFECGSSKNRRHLQLCMATRQTKYNTAFNPFTTRNRNTHVQWFDAELQSFYDFVEEQPLLTAEQEFQYGKALQMWKQVEQLRTQVQVKLHVEHRLSNDELSTAIGCSLTTLEKMEKYADISKTKLVNSNLKLVLAIVSRYRTAQISNSELIAEGTRGLAKAALRYDYTKGFRFATYATWYAHQAVADYVRWRKHPAKMPSRYTVLRRRVRQFTTEHKTSTGLTPSVTQIANALGQSHFDIIKVLTMQTYPALMGTPVAGLSSKPEGRERTMEDVIPSIFKAPQQQSESRGLRKDMEDMFHTNLNDVERDVLRLRLGLDDGRVKAVKEVGKRYHITWKEVRTVEKKALSKLLVSNEISEFADNYHSV